MKYDFESIIDRKGKDALAFDLLGQSWAPGAPEEGFDAIPMWIADMNFATVPTIPEAIKARCDHPVFGYFETRQEYYDAIINWHKEHKGVEDIKPENIGYENGVLGGVATALAVFCSKGDKVLVHSPTYVGFTGVLTNNGYNVIHSELKQDENHVWRMDFEDMEEKLRKEKIHAAIFCNPHNPCGRVWEKWEIEKAMELFKKYNVFVISDEIWSDLILLGNHHTPTQSVSEDAKMRTVALYAPSKTFNLAGLIGSYHVIYNSWIKDRMDKEASLGHYNSMNLLSMYGLMGAYNQDGSEWLSELMTVLTDNVNFAIDYINEHFEGVHCAKPEGTYMLFVDCKEWCEKHGKTIEDVIKACWRVGATVQDGRGFHGMTHLRINLASPKAKIREAFERMDKYVFNA